MNPIRPSSIRLEASTACQLKCPSCSTAQGKTHQRIGKGFLLFENFRKIIDDNPWIQHIELSNWGEIFLNPDLLKILEYSHQKGVMLTVRNGANFNTVKPEILEALVKYQVRWLTCALDGASQETYQRYRVNGKFDQVIEHIKVVNRYKDIYQSSYPVLHWQFVVFSHNEHEVEIAQQIANQLNMEFSLKLSWDESIAQVENPELIRKYLGAATRSEYAKLQGEEYLQKSICSQLWNSPQINWDGRLLGCCSNYWGDFGNAFESTLMNVLNGEKISYARQMLLGKVRAKSGIPCTSCKHYRKVSATQNWLTEKDIKLAKIQAAAVLRPSLSEIRNQRQYNT